MFTFILFRNGDSIKLQDGAKTKKFCGSSLPPSYESSGNELTISFAVVLNRERFSTQKLPNKKINVNYYVKDLTINKSIEVFEAKTVSCMYCFRIKVSFLSPVQKLSTHQPIETLSSDINAVDWSETEDIDTLLLGTASAATMFAGIIRK